MAEHISDLFEAGSLSHHAAGHRVPEDVGAGERRVDSRSANRACHDTRDGSARERLAATLFLVHDEHPAFVSRRTLPAQIADQRLPHHAGQWQHGASTVLCGRVSSGCRRASRCRPDTGVQRQLLLPLVLPHLRMLPAILRMIVPAVSDDREHAAPRAGNPLPGDSPWDRRSRGRRVSGGCGAGCAALAGRSPHDAPPTPVHPPATLPGRRAGGPFAVFPGFVT